MGELRRFQRAGECVTCGGAVRFYPAPVDDAQALAESADDVETSGDWVHLDPADWQADPHPVLVAS